MPKIVFVNPPLSHEERYGVRHKAGGWTPPTGLAYLAAVVRQKGVDVEIIDAAALGLSHEEAAEKILSAKPKYVGLTAVTIAINNAARVAELLKKSDPSITTIIGGAHFTALPKDTLERFSCFDVGVFGEGEATIGELLDSLEQNQDLSGVKGIFYRKDGKIIQTEQRPVIRNLDELPKPAWDLLPNLATHYSPPAHTVKNFPAALLVLSRGCPGRCKFCDRSVFGNYCRAHSARYAVNLIKELNSKYGIREFQIRDDNFLAYRKRLIEFCDLLKQEKLGVTWSCAGRVDMITPEILKLMKDAGCWQIWYGVESGSQEVLDFIGKNITLDQIRQAVGWTKEAGISPCGFFMLGLPKETKEDIEKTIRFSQELPIDEFHITFFTPFPGSEFYRTAKQYGEFDDDWKKMNCWLPIFVPKGMTVQQLEDYSKKAFTGFYLRPRQVMSYLKRIRSPRHAMAYFEGAISLLEFLVTKRKV